MSCVPRPEGNILMFAINHKNASLNADLSSTLKAWDKSEVNMLRVVVNETIHTIDTGDYRNLRRILVHVEGRKVVFSTVKAIVKAAVGKSISIGINDEGVSVSLAKKVSERGYDVANMKKLVAARDTDTIGLFNSAMLASIGISAGKAETPFDEAALAKACLSIVKRAVKADMDIELILQGVRVAYHAVSEGNKLRVEDNYIEHEGLKAIN